MKYVCDKCERVLLAKERDELMEIRTKISVYYLCHDCQPAFWWAVDSSLPRPTLRKEERASLTLRKCIQTAPSKSGATARQEKNQ